MCALRKTLAASTYAAFGFASSLSPSASRTLRTVSNSGRVSPFNDRYKFSRDTPACRATSAMPRARIVAPNANALVFRNRSGAPYTEDTLRDDFRTVRTGLYGKDDDRQPQDMRPRARARRSGADRELSSCWVRWPLPCQRPIDYSSPMYLSMSPQFARSIARGRPYAEKNAPLTKSLRTPAKESKENGSETLSP